MTGNSGVVGDTWAFTNFEGRVESMSRRACELFGIVRPRGDDLLAYLPLPRKTLLYDIGMAVDGWPAQRTVWLERLGGVISLQYRVSRRFDITTVQALYWHLAPSMGSTGLLI